MRGPSVDWRLVSILPTSPLDRRVRVIAWLNLVGNVLIIATGGAVRLTGSGLGCPTWPMCSAESFVNTPEMGIHGVIEFGNRTLSPVLGILAILLVLVCWRLGMLRVLALVVLGGVVLQGVVGGFTVLTGLNAWIVGFHYLASTAIVAVTTAIVVGTGGVRRRERSLPGWIRVVTWVAASLLLVVLVLGVLTTGSGPHSGDASAVRNGFAWDVLAHAHAYAGYALVAALLVLGVGALRLGDRTFLTRVTLVIAVVAVQIAVGIAQANTGIPPLLVGIHMVLAALAVAVTVLLVRSTVESRTSATSGPSS
jgi:cytochrome c oxidase assembly protein subunit 15